MHTLADDHPPISHSSDDAHSELAQMALDASPECANGQPWWTHDATERGAALGQLAIAIRAGVPLLSPAERRTLASALTEGLTPRSHITAHVLEFHRAVGLPEATWTPAVDELRVELIREEAEEAAAAIRSGDQKHIAKELADVVYVAVGAAIVHGIDLDLAVAEVHRSNMSKLVDGAPVLRADGKVLKGPNYRPPDMSACVPDQP
jgi:predicted HAD superfamily Cof-like phosphohydrolase